ncbi:MAG: ATP-binding cassette domain-containing protein [Thermodesulfobacteriota bacterium]|jgi:lipopolysaccharide transport system ATP-binding protein
MNDTALEFNHVWKKFKRGEKYNFLRDAIPTIVKRVFSRNFHEELEAGEFWAIKDVYFEVKRGEALAIICPNGAGKSTILKLLSGILGPNRGEIKVNGRLSVLIEVGAGFQPDLTGI